jgi:hypothetical protein
MHHLQQIHLLLIPFLLLLNQFSCSFGIVRLVFCLTIQGPYIDGVRLNGDMVNLYRVKRDH